MKVYIAGPMRGRPGWNHAAFNAAAKRWRDAGHEVYNPAESDLAAGVNKETAVSPQLARTLIIHGLQRLVECEAIAMLPGWENSLGALAEITLAIALDPPLELYDAETMSPLEPPDINESNTMRHGFVLHLLGPQGTC